jgi:hypothetical protein
LARLRVTTTQRGAGLEAHVRFEIPEHHATYGIVIRSRSGARLILPGSADENMDRLPLVEGAARTVRPKTTITGGILAAHFYFFARRGSVEVTVRDNGSRQVMARRTFDLAV